MLIVTLAPQKRRNPSPFEAGSAAIWHETLAAPGLLACTSPLSTEQPLTREQARRRLRKRDGQVMPSRRRNDSSPQRYDPITEAIANRAYELFLARGGQHGHDLDDWLQAEQELLDTMRSHMRDIKRGTDI